MTYVIGWRAALETICTYGGARRRVQELKLAVALEETLRVMSEAAPDHTADSRQAAEEADQLFEELGALIGVDDFTKVFDEADRLVAPWTAAQQ